jgi:hypothetical protein
MTTSPPTIALLTPPATQLKLPLTNPENSSPISPQEVWTKLNLLQREALFRQMVNLCCGLVADAEGKEASDE